MCVLCWFCWFAMSSSIAVLAVFSCLFFFPSSPSHSHDRYFVCYTFAYFLPARQKSQEGWYFVFVVFLLCIVIAALAALGFDHIIFCLDCRVHWFAWFCLATYFWRVGCFGLFPNFRFERLVGCFLVLFRFVLFDCCVSHSFCFVCLFVCSCFYCSRSKYPCSLFAFVLVCIFFVPRGLFLCFSNI